MDLSISDSYENQDNNGHIQTNMNKIFFKKIGESKKHLLKWIKLFESSLCLFAWVKQKNVPKDDLLSPLTEDGSSGLSKADISIRAYLKHFKYMIDDKIGNGTKTSKIHWLLHLTNTKKQFGNCNVVDGSVPEHCLSTLVKWPARHTQLRGSNLIEQTCTRYYENLIIDKSYNALVEKEIIPKTLSTVKRNEDDMLLSMNNSTSSVDKNMISAMVSIGNYSIHLNDNKEIDKISWKNTQKKAYISHSKSFLEQIIHRLHMSDFDLQSKSINCFTTLKMKRNGVIETYRADPHFHTKPWLDWCLTSWRNNDDDDCTSYAKNYQARIFMFIDVTDMNFGEKETQLEEYLAVVRCTKDDDRSANERITRNDSFIVNTYENETMFRIISCSSISGPAFVIPDLKDIRESNDDHLEFESTHVISLMEKDSWPDIFISNKWT